MRFSDETLMAYADGELDPEMRAAVDAAMASDPDLADAIALQIENRQALQSKLHAAFDGTLSEEIPQRLLNATRTTAASADVTELAAARAARATKATARWSLPQWAAIAASLVLGVFGGRIFFPVDQGPFAVAHGRMTARAGLAAALSDQSGGALDRKTGIQLGVSYLAKNGEYCRTFTLRDTQALGGLACRRDAQWAIDALAPTRADATGAYRMAGASVPALILGIVEATMAGEPLDAEQEAEARERGWER